MKYLKRKQLILMIISFALTGVTLLSAIFAWFVEPSVELPILFTTGSVEAEATLYQASSVGIEPITDSTYVPVTSDIVLDNLISGDIFRFKMVIKNKGTIPAKLSVTLIGLPNITLTQALNLKYSDLDGTTLNNELFSFPTGNFTIAIKPSLDQGAETSFYFQIEVNRRLTNAHYGQSFIINRIEVKLEQIIP